MISSLFSLEFVYASTGLVIWIFAVMTIADRGNPRRIGAGIFWFIFGLIFIAGKLMPHWLSGILVLLMVALDGLGWVRRGSRQEPSKERQVTHANRLKGKVFLPVLLIPLVTFSFAVVFRLMALDVTEGALVGLGFGGVAAMIAGLTLTGGSVREMMQEGHRLNDAMGAVNILPQLLASLGIIFTAAGVGDLIARGIHRIVPDHNLFLLVLANCFGMTLFTIVMGNSFAAFPVIAGGVLIPLIVRPYGVDPAMAAVLTLTAGASGTLITPMAANFNIVPAALLNMRDQYGVIRFQAPFALVIWIAHVLLLWLMIRY